MNNVSNPLNEVKPSLSIVIPCYNSEGSIFNLINKIFKLENLNYPIDEVICINDNSTDDTLNSLQSLKKIYPRLKILNNDKNMGQVFSTLSGISESSGNYIVTIDDDNQHPPEEIIKLVECCIKNNHDYSIGYWSPDEGFIRNISSVVANFLLNLVAFNFDGYKFTAFRVIKKEIKEGIQNKFANAQIIDLRKISKNYGKVKVRHNPFPEGRKYSNFKNRSIIFFKHLLNEIKQ